MKTLPKTINSKGFTYVQIAREGKKAIYRQDKEGYTSSSFETIKIGSHNGYELNGTKIPASETYPSSSLWGIQGWTFSSLEDAKKKFKRLS
jgi:hypothetical protein